MYGRQKTVLYLLHLAGRPVQRIELTKWCFLLRHDTDSRGGASFYDFVPYHYGPYSFVLNRETAKLEEIGYLRRHGQKAWVVNGELARSVSPPTSAIQRDAAKIVARFGSVPLQSLLDYVYHREPRFTVNSKRVRLAQRRHAHPRVYTVGYEGLSADALLNLLVQTGIDRIADVRRNPVARRYGFHGTTLSRLAGYLDIEYQHVPALGIPSAKRQSLRSEEDYQVLLAEYQRTTLAAEREAVDRVAGEMADRPTALMCMEAEPARCHRSKLAERVSLITGLPVEHLVIEQCPTGRRRARS